MAGFLGNLVTRTLGEAAAVHPRSPALFESLPLPAASSFEASTSAEMSQEPPSPLQPPPARPVRQPTPADLAPIQPAPAPPSSDAPARRARDHVARVPEAAERAHPLALERAGAIDLSTSNVPPPLRQTEPDRPGAATIRPRIEPSTGTGEVPSRRSAAAPEPAPTIRVTIGRVEVRAVTPQKPAPIRVKAAKTGPALSLSDYLKQRRGDQR